MRIADPGKGKSAEQAKQLRLKEWKRPTKKADRDKLRADRVAIAKGVMGYGDSVSDKGAIQPDNPGDSLHSKS